MLSEGRRGDPSEASAFVVVIAASGSLNASASSRRDASTIAQGETLGPGRQFVPRPGGPLEPADLHPMERFAILYAESPRDVDGNGFPTFAGRKVQE